MSVRKSGGVIERCHAIHYAQHMTPSPTPPLPPIDPLRIAVSGASPLVRRRRPVSCPTLLAPLHDILPIACARSGERGTGLVVRPRVSGGLEQHLNSAGPPRPR